MLMVLGQFVWSINTVAYQELKRKTDWRYASNNRVSKRPATQFVGLGSDKITVSGWFSPMLAGDPASIDKLRLMADAGEPYVLVSGTGAVFGLYEIESVTENTSLFYPNGTARRIDFTLAINRVDDDKIDQVGLIHDAEDLFV